MNPLELRCENRGFSLEKSSLKSTEFGLSTDYDGSYRKFAVSLTTYSERIY